MNKNDSFNDSDEVFSLYSSKNVKSTFKSQLQKIVSSSHSVNVNNEVASNEEISKNNATDYKEGNNTDSTSKSPVRPVKHSKPINQLEDLIEVISEFTPVRKTRRSERLRKKKGESFIDVDLSIDSPPKKQQKKDSKKGKKNRKQKGVPIDVVVLDDTIESESADEEELNPEVSVKVIWKSVNIKKFQMRKFQKFSKIFELLSQEENIPEDKIMLTFNNIRVCRNDTPDSLNLKVYHFLDGGVLSELTNSCDSNLSLMDNDNKISLKFQDSNKRVVKVKMDRTDKIKLGMIKCSEQLEIPIDKIKFYFDGELLKPSHTIESLGLDNDEIIDIKICS